MGCGGISELWLRALVATPALEPAGLVDLDRERARARAAEFDLDVPTGSDLGAMLDATGAELVFDCTVPAAHHEVTLTALGRGCHVFGEKPLADTLEQARAMIRAAREAGRTYAVMQNRRFDPNARRVRELIASGAIGEITGVDSDFYLGAHFGGFRESMPHVLVKDMAIHNFDMARFLSGRDAEAVYCVETNPVGSWYDRDAAAHAVFELEGGALFGYRGSWVAEGLPTTWESRWRVTGSRGSLEWDGATGLRCQVAGDDEGLLRGVRDVPVPTLEATAMPDWHAAAIRHTVDAITSGRSPETVADDNVKSLAMVLAAVDSSERRERVTIDPPEVNA